MSDYNYVAWFRDHTMEPDDQDYERPACFIITAPDAHAAQIWGDKLAVSYSRRNEGCQFLRSFLDLDADVWKTGNVPRITYGEEASDEVIGW